MKNCIFEIRNHAKKRLIMHYLSLFKRVVSVTMLLIVSLCGVGLQAQDKQDNRSVERVKKQLGQWETVFPQWKHVGKIAIDSVFLDSKNKLIKVFFSRPLSYIPAREEQVEQLLQSLKNSLSRKYRMHSIEVYCDNRLYESLIPNAFRNQLAADETRKPELTTKRVPLVWQVGRGIPEQGLYNSNIALWQSHGFYYESKLDRWEWQRARLFGTVEDLSTMSYVIPYLVPMLENSGAQVFLPRERDFQKYEVVVDNDGSTNNSEFIIQKSTVVINDFPGFKYCDTLYAGDNPFVKGSSLKVDLNEGEEIVYLPQFEADGNYGVYVAFQHSDDNSDQVVYTVTHSGGSTPIVVNQKMSGGTWVYLGNFYFKAGKNKSVGSVSVSRSNHSSGLISIDAVRFGGGMGNVARKPAGEQVANQWSLNDREQKPLVEKNENSELFKWKLSGKARYMEAARYYLQYAGFPDTLVYNLNENKNDYNDDYQSRGEWVNYLMGKPNGPTRNTDVEGLKIPVDLAFAFHTDAGVTPNDSIIGTLGIYSTWSMNGLFPNGKSRLASRDLTDLVQTQIVDDIQALYNPQWTRRAMWDRQYSEAWRPNVPVMLLELLSHQNSADMKLGLDPRFRFDVSRAIYKGILRFMASQNNTVYTVHPLPVNHFALTFIDENSVRLSWKPVIDPLEPTALPSKYKVYTRMGDNGFDNGVEVSDTFFVFKFSQANVIYSFKVAGVNDGGEGFSSEILSVGTASESKGVVLVVNGFDRVSAPEMFDHQGMGGIAWWNDQGVADKYEYGFTGFQYDFNRGSKWLDDDSPGWGASYANYEGLAVPGNSSDFPATHGKSILASGYSFVSVSDEVFEQPSFELHPFTAVDVIMGEEKSTKNLKDSTRMDFHIYTPGFMNKLEQLMNQGGRLFLSGAYLGSDLSIVPDSAATKFAARVLNFKWRTSHASSGNKIHSTDYVRNHLNVGFKYNAAYHPLVYTVENPDGIEPVGKNAVSAFRHADNGVSAGVLSNGTGKSLVLAIPFESIVDEQERHELMRQVLTFFEKK